VLKHCKTRLIQTLFPTGSTLHHKILLISFALLFKPNHKRNDVNLLQCNPVKMHLEFTIHFSVMCVKFIVNLKFEKICIMNFLTFRSKQIGTDDRNHHKGDKKGRPKKSQKATSPQESKKKKERASPSCGTKLCHPHLF